MNADGGTSPTSGSRQRTSASMPTICRVVDVHLRLVVQQELVVAQRAPQAPLEIQPRARRSRSSPADRTGTCCGPCPSRDTSRGRPSSAAVSASSPSCGNRLAPMLQPTYSSVPSSHTGSEIAARTRSIHAISDCFVDEIGQHDHELVAAVTRDRVARARAAREPLARPRASRRSPTLWPRLSLTFLKPSRSMKTTASLVSCRRAMIDRMLQAVAQQIAVRQARERCRSSPDIRAVPDSGSDRSRR